MEKEMKKLILVAASVGVFLIVIVSAAILLLSPRVQTQETAFSSYQHASTPRPITPGVEIISREDTQPLIDITSDEIDEETQIDFSSTVAIRTDTIDGNQVTLRVPKPTGVAVPDTPVAAAAPAPRTPEGARPSVSVQPAPQPRPASSSAASSSTSKPAAARPASAPARPASASASASTAARTPQRQVNDYWVQAGAFSAMVKAEAAREKLASKGITAIIENRVIDGQTWYRVRLGPYTSEREANYWLALVQSIEGFTGSQVRQTVSMR